MSLPKRGEAYDFQISLDSVSGNKFVTDPDIAAGDFTISKDDGALINLATLPVVTPSGSILVKISLTATEMTADKVAIVAADVAGNSWRDMLVVLDIPTGNIDTVNDLLEGDISESSTGVIIKKKGTSTEILNKDITGSLLSPSVTVTTSEP